MGLTALTGVLFGILPALKSSRLILFDALKSGARTATAGVSQERTRRGFVVVQLAISVVLLVAATLLTRTFVRLLQVEPGFSADRLAVIQLQLPTWKYQTGPARRQFADDLLGRIRSVPGVVSATASGGAPPNATNIRFDVPFEIEGRGVVLHDPALTIPFSSVPPEFFSVMGIPFKAGQTFPADPTPGTPMIVINERMAAALWKGENPVGQRFRMGSDTDAPWYTVVGVVGNVYQLDYGDTQGQMAYYLPASRTSAPSVQTWIVRTAGDPATIAPQLRQLVRAMDPQQPIWKLGTFRSQYVEFFALPRFYTVLMGTFAAIGVLIAGVGLYGVLAYAMAQRTREFGIRVALGATSRDVLWLVLRGGAMLTALGMTLGAAGSLIVTRSLASLLVDVPRIDPISYGLAIILLAGTALAACWIPAQRATRVDPVVALRAE
jgi:putative ABC transport system permease protein